MSSYHLTIEAEQDLRGIYQRGLNEFGVKQSDEYFDGLGLVEYHGMTLVRDQNHGSFRRKP
ncbi:MAG: hypothetical protein AAF603_08250, partial [Pseudomonadota bacterium]